MKVYLVKELINSEYGDYDVDKIFLSKEKAQNYVEEKEEELGEEFFENVWFKDEPIPCYKVEEKEVVE